MEPISEVYFFKKYGATCIPSRRLAQNTKNLQKLSPVRRNYFNRELQTFRIRGLVG